MKTFLGKTIIVVLGVITVYFVVGKPIHLGDIVEENNYITNDFYYIDNYYNDNVEYNNLMYILGYEILPFFENNLNFNLYDYFFINLIIDDNEYYFESVFLSDVTEFNALQFKLEYIIFLYITDIEYVAHIINIKIWGFTK